MTPTESAYLAGLTDGEGNLSIRYRRQRFEMRVSITNTDRRLLEWVRDTVGAGYINVSMRGNDRCKTAYRWVLAGLNAAEYLRSIRPYAISKRDQIDICLTYQSERDNGETDSLFWLMDQLTELTRRGPSPSL